jgi:hypothetical protein
MNLYSIKHSELAYRIDFAMYAASVLIMVAILFLTGTYERWLAYVALAVAGGVSWTLIEYALHRFVMQFPLRPLFYRANQRPLSCEAKNHSLSRGYMPDVFFYSNIVRDPLHVLPRHRESRTVLLIPVILNVWHILNLHDCIPPSAVQLALFNCL